MILAAGRGERMRPLTDAHAQAAARGRRQAADRLAPRAPRARRLREVGRQRLAPRPSRSSSALGDGARFGAAHRLFARAASRSRPRAASRTRCRCSATQPFLLVNADIYCDFDFARLRGVALRRAPRAPGAGAEPAAPPGGDFSLDGGHRRQRRARRATLTRHRRDVAGARRRRAAPATRRRSRRCCARRPSAARVSGELYRGLWQDVGTAGAARRTGGACSRSSDETATSLDPASTERRRARLAQAHGRRRRRRADRARARAQPRHALSLPLRQPLLLPHRLSPSPRRCWSIVAGAGAAEPPLLPREERRARDLGRLSLRPGGARASASASTRPIRSASSTSSCRRCSTNQPALYYPVGADAGVGRARHALAERGARAGARRHRARRTDVQDVRALLDEMRLVKDAHELAMMRRAARISAGRAPARDAARRARAAANTRSKPSCCTSSAATARSSRPTRRSSPAARTPACCTTCRTTRALRDGDLLLIDAGCELDGYASDITRTFPVNGALQRARSARSTKSCSRRSAPRSRQGAPGQRAGTSRTTRRCACSRRA